PIVDTRPFASEPRAHARNRSTHEPDLGPREPDPSEERGHFVPDGFTHTVPRRGPCRGRVASRSRSTSRGHGVPASVRGSTDTVEGTAGSARFGQGERDAAGGLPHPPAAASGERPGAVWRLATGAAGKAG